MYSQLIKVMYTGGNGSSETSPSNGSSSETSPSNGSSSETGQSQHGPRPDQPVGAIKPNYLTDDHLKVVTGFSSWNETSPESSQDPDQISKLNYLIDDQQQVTTGLFTFFMSITLGTLPSQG
jgi:hypothetical protein